MSLTLEETVSSCGLGKEGLQGHGHHAELRGQGGWWLWTNKVVTWNPVGWASLSHFLPVPTVSLSHLQEVGAVRWRVRSPGSSLTLAVVLLHDPQPTTSPCWGSVSTSVTPEASVNLQSQAKGFFRVQCLLEEWLGQGPLCW